MTLVLLVFYKQNEHLANVDRNTAHEIKVKL